MQIWFTPIDSPTEEVKADEKPSAEQRTKDSDESKYGCMGAAPCLHKDNVKLASTLTCDVGMMKGRLELPAKDVIDPTA